MASWGATKAKAQFSAMLDKVETEGPQRVTRRKETFLVLTKEAFDACSKPPACGCLKKREESAWDALRPPAALRFDYEFPRLKAKARAAKF